MAQSRLERILEDGYLDGLASWSTAEVRRARAECEAEEEGISYARRVLQGRLDILRAELLRREEDDDHAEDLLARLARILSRTTSRAHRRRSRSTRLRVPDDADRHEAEIDALMGSASPRSCAPRSSTRSSSGCGVTSRRCPPPAASCSTASTRCATSSPVGTRTGPPPSARS
jgi:hypothetical protein